MAKNTFKFFLLCAFVCSVLSLDVTFFKNASSVCASGCSFTDVSIWNPRVPQIGDSVFIDPDNVILITVSQPLNVSDILMSNTTFSVQSTLFTAKNLTATSSDLKFSGSTVDVAFFSLSNTTTLELSACTAFLGTDNDDDNSPHCRGPVSLKNGNALHVFDLDFHQTITDDGISGNISIFGYVSFFAPSEISQNIIVHEDGDVFIEAHLATTGSVNAMGRIIIISSMFTADTIQISNSHGIVVTDGVITAKTIDVIDGYLSSDNSSVVADVNLQASGNFQIYSPSNIQGTLELSGTYTADLSEVGTLSNGTYLTVSGTTTLNEGCKLEVRIDATLLSESKKEQNGSYSVLKANQIDGNFTKNSFSLSSSQYDLTSKSVVQKDNEVVVFYSYKQAPEQKDKKFPTAAIVVLVVLPVIALIIAAVWFFRKRFSYSSLD